MTGNDPSAVVRQVQTLFTVGAVGGLTDEQLLERFVTRSDAGAEVAFAALVQRHGPMVWGVCRRTLDDPHAAADAFQATFLILVRKAGTVGVPLPDTEISIRPLGGGDALPAGERGEVCIRGPQVMRGYAGRPDATAESIDADGWFHTGDVGVLDADGYLSIVDRTKDMLLYKGYNVFPRELEELLFALPGVAAAAVWEAPPRAPASVRPALSATIGLLRAMRRACRRNFFGLPNDSRYSAMTLVVGSSSQ